MPDLRALAGNMSLNTFHFYVGADTPYAGVTMDDIFKGKKPIRLAISKPGSSDVWVFEKVMEHYGLSYKDWEAAGARFFRGSYTEQAGALKDPHGDGPFPFLGRPGAPATGASVGRSLKPPAFPDPRLPMPGQLR